MKCSAWLVCLLPLLGVGSAQAQLYSVTDLGTFGGSQSYATAINNSGTIAGDAFTTGDATDHAFSYSGGVMTDLGTLGGATSDAYGINASGTIAGTADNLSNHLGFSYSGGVMTSVGSFAGGYSIAYGINSSGTVVGTARNPADGGNYSPVLFSGGTAIDLGLLGGTGAIYSPARAINNAGTIVGQSTIAGDTAYHAFSYSGGVMTDLGTLGGNNSSARFINTAGTIVGFADTASASHAYSYSGGVMTDLGTLGGTNSDAYGINTNGIIVGESNDAGGAQHAFYMLGGVMTDLNTVLNGSGSGWTLQFATAINDSNQIVGYGLIGGQTHAFLLDAIPEPSSCAMLVGGLGLLGAVLRRKSVTRHHGLYS